MQKLILTAVVETGKDLFSCFLADGHKGLDIGLVGDGKTVREAMADLEQSRDEARQWYAEEGREFPEVEFRYVFDVGAFFDYYPLNITNFAKYIGMNPSLMRQYAAGIREPRGKSLQRIREGISSLLSDIDVGRLTDRPVQQYV